jgi:SAM-dependent methyltransferase
MILNKIKNYEAYVNHVEQKSSIYINACVVEKKIQDKVNQENKTSIQGYSWPAQSNSSFLVDKLYAHEGVINFRERLVCEKTDLNNRIRGSIHIFEDYFKAQINDFIYLTEQCTTLGKWMQDKYRNLEASEYLIDVDEEKQVHMNHYLTPHKLKHQDLTDLSFDDETFKFILSFDCFEHIPDYKNAFKECLRVLKPKGKIIWSVPFDINNQKNLVRAQINEDGSITHNTEPEYHGNPLSDDGCLSFYTFGWQMLEQLKEMGYSKTYLLLYWSEKYAYLGGEQILLCAEK